MHEKPKLQVSKDYSIFEPHPLNRDLAEKPVLLASMREHGFMPSSPVHCVRVGSKLRVIRGHHRVHYAKRLGIPVWYIVDNSNTDIYDLEGDSSVRWSVLDFLVSRANAGDTHSQKVLDFRKRHNLTLGAAISLMGGESAGSENGVMKVKRGNFRVSNDLRHAYAVVGVTDHFRGVGVPFATASAFVIAVSLALRVPECDPEILKHRISLNPALIQKRGTVDAYLDELDALYNYAAKKSRFPLAFSAREASRDRKNFGKKRTA